jgi:hypothetical protein
MRKITKDELFYMSKVPRLNLVNCVTGYKSANLIGSISAEGNLNVAIFSSVTHLGTEPPLLGFILILEILALLPYTKEIIEIMDIFRTINPTLNYGNRTNRQSCQDLIAKFGIANAVKMAKYAIQVQGQDYAPTITTPYQLKEKLAQLKIYSDKTNKTKTITV